MTTIKSLWLYFNSKTQEKVGLILTLTLIPNLNSVWDGEDEFLSMEGREEWRRWRRWRDFYSLTPNAKSINLYYNIKKRKKENGEKKKMKEKRVSSQSNMGKVFIRDKDVLFATKSTRFCIFPIWIKWRSTSSTLGQMK